MLFDPHKPILNRTTNRPLVEVLDEETSLTVTHGLLAARALDAKFPDDKPEEAMKRFMLGTRIIASKPGETMDLTIPEATMIRDCTAKAFSPGLWGQVWVALDEAAKAPVANGAPRRRIPQSCNTSDGASAPRE